MNRFKNRTRFLFPSALQFAFILMVIVGVIALLASGIQALLPALGMIFVGLLGSTTSEGTEIDFDNKRIRVYTQVLFLSFGKWQSFPKFNRLTLAKATLTTTFYAGRSSNSAHMKEYKFQAKLYYKNSHAHYLLSSSSDQKKALEAAMNVSKALPIPLEDFSEKNNPIR
jgi:hypothetical protein